MVRAVAASEFEQLLFVPGSGPIGPRPFAVVYGGSSLGDSAFRRGLSALALGTPRSIRTRDTVPSVSRVFLRWSRSFCAVLLLARAFVSVPVSVRAPCARPCGSVSGGWWAG
ncbi:nitronate monooxygenase [Anopheles sinensis]|uniref:Nitronate monooxygenase n=1 Tax=Anopheles sinensis TaxID=74873 RepID=A0A084VI34_ANOSI|nr:nitronate monooxygenase [Anopheles sinensis]